MGSAVLATVFLRHGTTHKINAVYNVANNFPTRFPLIILNNALITLTKENAKLGVFT
jgi:hypothetical protein